MDMRLEAAQRRTLPARVSYNSAVLLGFHFRSYTPFPGHVPVDHTNLSLGKEKASARRTYSLIKE